MLAVQVQYQANVEQKRHNVVTEQESIRHNKVQEDLGYKNLFEVIRHDKAQEDYWNRSLEETQRHNLVQESIEYQNALTNQQNAISNRMNAQSNAYNAQTNRIGVLNSYSLGLEANRIAAGNLEETQRRNVIQARQTDVSAERSATQSMIDKYNAITQRHVQEKQAEARLTSAEASKLNALASLKNANLNQGKFGWQKKMDVWQNILGTGNLLEQHNQNMGQVTTKVLGLGSKGGNSNGK